MLRVNVVFLLMMTLEILIECIFDLSMLLCAFEVYITLHVFMYIVRTCSTNTKYARYMRVIISLFFTFPKARSSG